MNHQELNGKKKRNTNNISKSRREISLKRNFHFQFHLEARFKVKEKMSLIQHFPRATLQNEVVPLWSSTSRKEVFIWTEWYTFENLSNQDTMPSSDHTRYCSQNVPTGALSPWVQSQTKLTPLHTNAGRAQSNEKGLHQFILRLLREWVIKKKLKAAQINISYEEFICKNR